MILKVKKIKTLTDLSIFLNYSFGTNTKRNLRFYASAGGLFCVYVYLYLHNIKGIKPGIYKYYSPTHELELIKLTEIKINKYLSIEKEQLSNQTTSGILNYKFVIFYVFETYIARFKYHNLALRFGLIETGLMMHNADLISAALDLPS